MHNIFEGNSDIYPDEKSYDQRQLPLVIATSVRASSSTHKLSERSSGPRLIYMLASPNMLQVIFQSFFGIIRGMVSR